MGRDPCHVVADVFDRNSLCGIKDPYPVVLARHVGMHVRGWGMTVCAECRHAMVPAARRA